MDPSLWGGIIKGGVDLLGKGIAADAKPPNPNQTADGAAYGGNSEGRNAGGSTGGAYGGAFSFGGVDGSNWNVSTSGNGNTQGGGKSGGNSQTPQLNAAGPQNPFQAVGDVMAGGAGGASSGHFLLIGLAILAYVIIKG